MSKSQNSETKVSSLENIFRGANMKIIKTSLKKKEIIEERRKVLGEKKNIASGLDDAKLISIENKTFKLLAKKSNKIQKRDPTVNVNLKNKEKKIESSGSNEFKGLPPPVVENSQNASKENLKNIIQDEAYSENEKSYSEKSMQFDISNSFLEMIKTINQLFLEFNIDDIINDINCKELVNEYIKENNITEGNIFSINTMHLKEYLKEILINKITKLIEIQMENKRRQMVNYRLDNRDINLSETKKRDVLKELKIDKVPIITLVEEPLFDPITYISFNSSLMLSLKEFNDTEYQQFNHSLLTFMKDRGVLIIKYLQINNKMIDLFKLYNIVVAHGGFVEVTQLNVWSEILIRFGIRTNLRINAFALRLYYGKYLYPYEQANESSLIPSWLFPPKNNYCSNIQKETFSKDKDPLMKERSKVSSVVMKYFVEYLESNKNPKKDLFPNALRHILQRFNNEYSNKPLISTDKIPKVPTNTPENPSSFAKDSSSSKVILPTGSIEDDPLEKTSEIKPVSELKSESESKSELTFTTKISPRQENLTNLNSQSISSDDEHSILYSTLSEEYLSCDSSF